MVTVYQVSTGKRVTYCRAVHLDKCCEYWYYNYANKDNPNPEEFKFPVEMALELLIAADFLDCKFPLHTFAKLKLDGILFKAYSVNIMMLTRYLQIVFLFHLL